jgi:hypothetical protein
LLFGLVLDPECGSSIFLWNIYELLLTAHHDMPEDSTLHSHCWLDIWCSLSLYNFSHFVSVLCVMYRTHSFMEFMSLMMLLVRILLLKLFIFKLSNNSASQNFKISIMLSKIIFISYHSLKRIYKNSRSNYERLHIILLCIESYRLYVIYVNKELWIKSLSDSEENLTACFSAL